MMGKSRGGDYSDLIVELVKLSGCETYLELGVFLGTTFQKVCPLVKRCIGVDISDKRTEKVGEFYEETTDKFFSNFKDKADVVFVDADHRYESGKSDFNNSIKILSPHGIIILHDTDPIDKAAASFEASGDVYRILDYIQCVYPELSMVTLPLTDAGMTIVNRRSDRRIFSHKEDK